MQHFFPLLLLPLASSSPASPAPVYRPRLPIEAHGFNSLGAWPQLLLKRTRWFKIDLGLSAQSSCERYSTFGQPGKGNASDCFSEGGGVFCCIGLSGDTGSRPNLLDPFNTTADLVDFFNSSQLLPLGSASSPQLLIGLDFGGSPSACLSNCPGAALVRRFLLAAWEVIQRRNLSLAFALDSGIGGWYADLDNLCASGGCSEADKALAAMPWIAQGGAPWRPPSGAAAARYRILNEDYSSFETCCSSGCWSGGEGATGGFPWLWYEQTGQADYLKLLSWWAACPALPAARRADINSGLNFVSNEAPEMAEVFAAPSGLLGRGANALLPHTAAFSRPLTLSAPLAPSTTGPDRALVLLSQTSSAPTCTLGIWSLPHRGLAPPPPGGCP